MTLTYSLTEEDYLQSQLFIASKSDRIKKQRRKDWLFFSGLLLLVGVVFSLLTFEKPILYYFLANYFVGVMVISFVAYPPYQRNPYIQYYRKYVAEAFKESLNKQNTIKFNNDFIDCLDAKESSKLNLTDVVNVYETAMLFSLQLKTGAHLIIPKAELNNGDDVRTLLTTLSKKLNINFISDLNWEWK